MYRKFIAAFFIFSMILGNASTAIAQTTNDLPVYLVQPGDTLITIASRFGVSATDIINANQIQNQDFISPGDGLRIPGLQGITGTLTSLTVPLGESLDSLARTYATSPGFIVKINRLTSPYEVYAGASLIIPVPDSKPEHIPVKTIEPGSTLLEAAALLQENPRQLQESNELTTRNLLPGSVLYDVAAEGRAAINVLDPSLTRVSINPLPLMQGGTFEIIVTSSVPVTLEGTLAGNQLTFFSESENKFVALQGIHAMAQPGVYDFTLKGQFGNGTGFSMSQPVLLISGDYPKDAPLTVDPATIDPAVTNPEDDFIKNLVSILTPVRQWDGIFEIPGQYAEYTSRFGDRRSYNGSDYTYFHSGLDFAGGMGLPIKAPADGTVVLAGPLTVRGNATFIDHGWGIYSGFFHQSEIKVKVGDRVKKGDIIGLVGNTGRVNNAFDYPGAGAHLHWEVWVNGVQVNPMTWMNTVYP